MSPNQLTHAQGFRGQTTTSLYREGGKVKFLKSALLVTLPSPATQPLSTAHKEQRVFAFNWYPVDGVLGLWTLSRGPYFRKETEQREQTWRHPRIRRRLGQGVHLLPVEVVIVCLTIPARAVRLIKEAATCGGSKRDNVSHGQESGLIWDAPGRHQAKSDLTVLLGTRGSDPFHNLAKYCWVLTMP